MYTITKEFCFEAAHRLEGHPKCGRLHGHSYRVIFELQAEDISSTGMVRDYADLGKIKEYIDNHLDHRYLVSEELDQANDPIALACSEIGEEWAFFIPIERTTAEQLAAWFYGQFKGDYPELTAVTVCETSKTSATYRFERGLR